MRVYCRLTVSCDAVCCRVPRPRWACTAAAAAPAPGNNGRRRRGRTTTTPSPVVTRRPRTVALAAPTDRRRRPLCTATAACWTRSTTVAAAAGLWPRDRWAAFTTATACCTGARRVTCKCADFDTRGGGYPRFGLGTPPPFPPYLIPTYRESLYGHRLLCEVHKR